MADKLPDLSKKSHSSTTESELPSSQIQREEKQFTPSNITISSGEEFLKSVEEKRMTNLQKSMKWMHSRQTVKESKTLTSENVNPGNCVKNRRKISAGFDINRATKRKRDGKSSSNTGTEQKPKVLDGPDYSGRATENCFLSRPSTSTDRSCIYVPTAIKAHYKQFSFVCEHCSRSFQYHSRYETHVRSHTGERPFQCQECGKRFRYSNHLTVHKTCHTGERLFQCQECGERFRYSSQLTVHKRFHTGERPFKCQECGKQFVKSSHLTEHKSSHTGEKPFQCQECGKQFGILGNLTKHKIIHTSEKPYSCPICGKDFSSKSNMKSHEKTHKGK